MNMKKLIMAAIAGTTMAFMACGNADQSKSTAETKTEAVAEKSEKEEPLNIVEMAMQNEEFSTLVAAVKAAGLVDALSGEGPFTVFAPTNEAFAKLPEGTVEELLKPENKEKLASILTYHVVPMKVMAKDVKTMMATTVNGSEIDVKVQESSVWVDQAMVTSTDIVCSNGVIHVINEVIMP